MSVITRLSSDSQKFRVFVSIIALLVLVALLVTMIALPRYQFGASAQQAGIYRLDVWTGEVRYCLSRWESGALDVGCYRAFELDPDYVNGQPVIDFDKEDALLQQQGQQK